MMQHFQAMHANSMGFPGYSPLFPPVSFPPVGPLHPGLDLLPDPAEVLGQRTAVRAGFDDLEMNRLFQHQHQLQQHLQQQQQQQQHHHLHHHHHHQHHQQQQQQHQQSLQQHVQQHLQQQEHLQQLQQQHLQSLQNLAATADSGLKHPQPQPSMHLHHLRAGGVSPAPGGPSPPVDDLAVPAVNTERHSGPQLQSPRGPPSSQPAEPLVHNADPRGQPQAPTQSSRKMQQVPQPHQRHVQTGTQPPVANPDQNDAKQRSKKKLPKGRDLRDAAFLGSESVLDLDFLSSDFRGSVLDLCQQQSGSRYLQRQLARGNPKTVEFVLSEIEDHLETLMCDQYGNYLCQELFSTCTAAQRQRILEKLGSGLIDIAKDRRGTHALLALIGLLSAEAEQATLINAMKDNIVELAMDQHGTHVVQKAAACRSRLVKQTIFAAVLASFRQVAQNPFGLCVVKKCITESAGMRNVEDQLIVALTREADLVQNMYGNYAVQHALETWGGERMREVVKQVFARFVVLSNQKCSSNVVEKCLIYTDEETRRHVILETTKSPDRMNMLLGSTFGNYVLLRAAECVTGPPLKQLLQYVERHLRHTPNKRIRQRWEQLLESQGGEQRARPSEKHRKEWPSPGQSKLGAHAHATPFVAWSS
mmetsp:Transcript_34764/g.90685  ORF Transcript_34764/g.90685 Transcript_34764/m.90685 type:complete len:644 (-) Transcript_34764:180-2111(-)